MITYFKDELQERPWGFWKVEEVGEDFIKKLVVVRPDSCLSLQSHKHREENWTIIKGEAEVTLNTQTHILKTNDTIIIPRQAIHRIKNIGTTELHFYEIQTGDLLDENDIIRYDDIYGRTTNVK
ncbi:MAG: phosphomannose isomerase type II C-terminal cupin domain [Alphaproteobacteria bacterium]|nr:phosphomannose isomerase type II C-terminal cupin domain [Alphaproteobacteria bacterium]